VSRNIGELLAAAAARRPDHVAIVDRGERLTWAAVFDEARATAQALVSAGLSRGDRVAVYADHGLAQIVSLFGVALADGIFTIVNPLLRPDQVIHQISDASARFVVGQPALLGTVEGFLRQSQATVIEIDAAGRVSGDRPRTADLAPARAIPADVGCLIYTSGSTGKSKGVVVPHRTLLDGARIVSGYLGIGPDDITLSLLPYNFDYGFNQVLTATHHAARIVVHRFVLPKDLLDVAAAERVTGFAAVPTLWPKLLDPRFVDPAARPALPALRYVTTAGGVHGQSMLTRLSAFFPGVSIYIMYGLTESFRSTYLPPAELLRRPGAIGKAVPEVEILVVDADGNPCPPGVQGELIHRGAFVNYGYLNNPDLTKAKYIELPTGGPGCRPEIAVRSGDLVSLDADGFLYFHGRIDQQIKSMGYRVSPGEVEETASSFAGISHVAAFGVPDETVGEAIILVCTTYPGQKVEAAALRRHLQEQLPPYAVPRRITFLEKLPQTVTGKVDYPLLRRQHLQPGSE
jgi:acyl-CoA synthetase (AMP-forming)/AMP-acid ligase II